MTFPEIQVEYNLSSVFSKRSYYATSELVVMVCFLFKESFYFLFIITSPDKESKG